MFQRLSPELHCVQQAAGSRSGLDEPKVRTDHFGYPMMCEIALQQAYRGL